MEIRSFLDLAGYYRRFVKGFFKIASPLADLLKIASKFEWIEKCKKSIFRIEVAINYPPNPNFTSGR